VETVEQDRQLIQRILLDYARIPYSHGQFESVPVFDREADHYLVMTVGRDGIRRVHGCLIHVDLIDGKFWIQRDGTEYGIGQELLDAGIPKDRIVLAFMSPERRKLTEFAVA
jgi:hypothetical protein